MARTQAQVLAELKLLAHPIYTDNAMGLAILNGLAKVLASAEAAWDASGGWLDQLSLSTASGAWLDLHAAMQGVEREPGQSDDELRAEALLGTDALTVSRAQALVDAALARQGEGYSAVLVEPYTCVLDEGLYLDTVFARLSEPLGTPGRPRYLAWVELPMPEVAQPFDDGAFVGDGLYLDVRGYLGESAHDVADRPYVLSALARVEARRPLGVAIGFAVSDLPQDAYFELWAPQHP